MGRYFTLDQAQKSLGQVEPIVRRIKSLHEEFREAEAEIQDVTQKVMVSGGMRVDLGSMAAYKRRRDASGGHLRESIESLQDIGCLLKDFETGLVDFPTQFRGEEVYLCWKLGEKGICFWHGIDEGFGGRKKIDREFLDHHSGE